MFRINPPLSLLQALSLHESCNCCLEQFLVILPLLSTVTISNLLSLFQALPSHTTMRTPDTCPPTPQRQTAPAGGSFLHSSHTVLKHFCWVHIFPSTLLQFYKTQFHPHFLFKDNPFLCILYVTVVSSRMIFISWLLLTWLLLQAALRINIFSDILQALTILQNITILQKSNDEQDIHCLHEA